MSARGCSFLRPDGTPCGAPPLHDRTHCFFHDPDSAREAAEARRLGGLRRRREGTLAGAFDVPSIRSLEDLRRIYEVALFDTLALDNSVARNRTLASLIALGVNVFAALDLKQQMDRLEASLQARERGASPFDQPPIEGDYRFLPEEDDPS